MKVVEGNFSPDEGPIHAGERLKLQLEDSGVLERNDGVYTLLFDTGDSMFILSNGDGPGDVLLTMEKGKTAVMANVYGSKSNES
jgi:hypothetical protein